MEDIHFLYLFIGNFILGYFIVSYSWKVGGQRDLNHPRGKIRTQAKNSLLRKKRRRNCLAFLLLFINIVFLYLAFHYHDLNDLVRLSSIAMLAIAILFLCNLKRFEKHGEVMKCSGN